MENMEKLARIGRQAMNIQAIEAEFQLANSDGERIEGTENIKAIIYNLEKISMKEVEKELNDGSYSLDPRILVTDQERLANLFPHRGELKRTEEGPSTYWKPCSYKNDYVHCECSACGFTIEAIQAVDIGTCSDDYVGVQYRFCPKCGSYMSHKAPEETGNLDVSKILQEGKEISSREATADVIPVDWSNTVLGGECKDQTIIKEHTEG